MYSFLKYLFSTYYVPGNFWGTVMESNFSSFYLHFNGGRQIITKYKTKILSIKLNTEGVHLVYIQVEIKTNEGS